MSVEIEFCDTSTLLYRLYDGDSVLLYIGMTAQLPVRIGQHVRMQPWWPEVTRKTLMVYDSWDDADAAETAAIAAENPKYNKAEKRFGSVKERDAADLLLRRFIRDVDGLAAEAARKGWTFGPLDPQPRLEHYTGTIFRIRAQRDLVRRNELLIPLPMCPFCRGDGGNPGLQMIGNPSCRPCLATGFDLARLIQSHRDRYESAA